MKKIKYWYLVLTESCFHCGYTEGFVFSPKEDPPKCFEKKFKTKRNLLKYAKENNIELDL